MVLTVYLCYKQNLRSLVLIVPDDTWMTECDKKVKLFFQTYYITRKFVLDIHF